MLTSGPNRQIGVSLIELVIGLAIIAMLLRFGIPSLGEWIQNAQIRTASESVLNGLQKARAEAVRQNTNVEFILTAPGSTGGTGWIVRLANTGATIESKPAGEGSANVVLTPTPADANRITFTGLGRTPTNPALNADGSSLLTRIDADSAALSAAESREMRVVVSTGGSLLLCDPNIADTTDPRACP